MHLQILRIGVNLFEMIDVRVIFQKRVLPSQVLSDIVMSLRNIFNLFANEIEFSDAAVCRHGYMMVLNGIQYFADRIVQAFREKNRGTETKCYRQ
ncbi:hypothetical protein D3C73_1162300 [compost metagenome]